MRIVLALFLLLLIGCKRSSDTIVTGPPTDHTMALEAEAPVDEEEEHDSLYITYVADTTALSPAPTTPLRILLEGSFHKNEVWKDAEKDHWLGIYYEAGQYFLRPAKVQVKPAFDPVLDAEQDSNGVRLISGREVVSEVPNVVFFVSGLDLYKEGKLDTVAFARSIIPANKNLDYTFNGKSFRITAHGDSVQASSGEFSYRNYGWDVIGYKKGKLLKQNLAETEWFDDSIFTLLWAGDLDRDGIPDLLIDTSNHYNVSTVTLFLSSKAEKGKLYRKVAVFETVGC